MIENIDIPDNQVIYNTGILFAVVFAILKDQLVKLFAWFWLRVSKSEQQAAADRHKVEELEEDAKANLLRQIERLSQDLEVAQQHRIELEEEFRSLQGEMRTQTAELVAIRSDLRFAVDVMSTLGDILPDDNAKKLVRAQIESINRRRRKTEQSSEIITVTGEARI